MQVARHFFAVLSLSPESPVPLHRQLYSEMREAVLSGRLQPGNRLPSTRDLARELRVSRNTVIEAFEQLIAEGYFESHTGVGTFVSSRINTGKREPSASPSMPANEIPPPFVRKFEGLRTSSTDCRLPFCPGVPAIEEFPTATWARLSARRAAGATRALLNYGDPLGYAPLREALAEYLGASRGVRCSAEQVMIVNGAQHGLDLIGRMMLEPGDGVWIEDPGYLLARNLFHTHGARLVPIAVDAHGMDVDAGIRAGGPAKLVYISPSHQYPLGVTMPLERRLRLLDWARSSNALVIEDDYDSEFQFSARSLPALQGLDPDGVLYLGTLSKVMFPSLRLGYVVFPRNLRSAFADLRGVIDCGSPTLDQAVLADFIREGYFARHLRRMRSSYEERRASFVLAAKELFDGSFNIEPSMVGLHLLLWLSPDADDQAVVRHLRSAGFGCSALSSHCLARAMRPGLVLGYGGLRAREMKEHLVRLRDEIASMSEAAIGRTG